MVDRSDPLGDLAHIITGSIAGTCCHTTGGYNTDPRCECRCIAEQIVDNADAAIDAIQRGKLQAQIEKVRAMARARLTTPPARPDAEKRR